MQGLREFGVLLIETVRFSGAVADPTSRSTRKPDNDESSLLQLFIHVPGNSAVTGIGGGHWPVRTVGADAAVDDDFDFLDAGETGGEVLVEVRTILGDDDEDPHAGSLPRRRAGGAIFRAVTGDLGTATATSSGGVGRMRCV
jgi:hypothetical protein